MKMIRRSALAFALLLPVTAQAQSWTTYDNAGRATGSIVTTPGGGASLRDNAGRQTGTVATTPGGGASIRDNAGRQVGTAAPQTGTRR